MFKKLLITLVALTGMSFGQTVHTPTLEGNYTWTGTDTWTFGNFQLSGDIPQCPTGKVMQGYQADLTPNCVLASSTGFNWSENLSANQGSTDTTISLNEMPSGLTAPGTFFVDGEYETFTGISGLTLTGITRGVSHTTPMSHSASAQAFSVNVPASPFTQAPWGGFFGGNGAEMLSVNCGSPTADNDNGAITVFQANCGSNKMWIDSAGAIHQTNDGVYNFLAPFYLAPGLASDFAASSYPIPVTNTTLLVQTNGQYQFTQPMGFGSPIVGPVRAVPVPNIPAPTVGGVQGGSCSITYEVAGVDADGNSVPGTAATATGLTFPSAGLVEIQTPLVAGIVTYNVYRTAVSNCGGVVTVGKFASSTTAAYPFWSDTGLSGDGTTPPASNNSVAKQCVGTAANPELYCKLSGSSSSPPVACSSSTYGWDYTNVAATSGANLHCYSGQTTWTTTDTPNAIQSINGDTTSAQQIKCTGGGCSAATTGGITTISMTGGGLTGAVGQGNFGQLGGFATTGGSTTISGAQNIYALNPGWSLTQMNALFSRFNTVTFTAWSITSNVVTFTGNNSYSAGDEFVASGFTTGNFLNNNFFVVTSATSTSVVATSGSVSHANASATENGSGTMNQPGFLSSNAIVFIPPGMTDAPANAFTNTVARTLDWRKGYALQQASQYGVKCGLTSVNVTLSTTSNQVTVGSSLDATSVGDMMVVAQQVGYGNDGLQEDWEPTVTAYNSGTFAVTLSSNPPFNYSGPVLFGINNQTALQRAVNDVGGMFPLWLPQCSMLTDTIRWNGASLLGQQMNYTSLVGLPAHDVLQAQDGIPITAWSINATTGVTTFTIPAYAAHSILPSSLYPAGSGVTGDNIILANFPTSTFFNNVEVNIATQPTPTTFTVNNVFGQSTSSSTEAGLAEPTTGANTNAVRVENTTFKPHNGIDGSFTWNHYAADGTETVEPPYYRPVLEFGQRMNNPFGPGWGTGAVNGIAKITQNSAVICISTTVVGGNTPRIPATGTTIVFPYQGDGLFSATVSSTAGSCSTGYTPITMSAALPNNAAFTAAQAEWFTFTTPQTLSVAMPASITLPYTITAALPFPPVAGAENNVSSHGHIIINGDEWDYMGVTYGGTVGGNATFTLRNGPAGTCNASTGVCSVNGGTGNAIGSVIFPLNPCQAMYNNPWPVVPTLNSGAATPIHATYYAGDCGGNAGIAFPAADAAAWNPFGNDGLSLAHFIDVSGNNLTTNALGNANNNGSMLLYEGGDNTGYGNTFDDIRVDGLWGGIMQGPASVNQFGVATVGPTSTGQSIKNCTFRSTYSIALENMEQSNLDRCDTYSSETSPYDGTVVGSSTDLSIKYTLNEQTGGVVTNVAQFTVKDYNGEPENGNHDEFPASVESDGTNITWIGNIFEGGYNIFGGSFQRFIGTQLAGPVFNYGTNNYFDKMYGTSIGYNDGGVYNGALSLYNWGAFSTCEDTPENGGPNQGCGPDFLQSWNGHDAWASMMGNNVHPNYNILGGVISPDEFGYPVFDSTELWYGRHFECAIGSGDECIYTTFASTYIPIGPFRRITDTQEVLKANVKLKNSGTATFRILLTAQNGLSTSCSPNFNLTNATFTATSSGWTPVQMPVDFTGYAGCTLGVQFDSGSATNTLEVGYFNFVPFPGQLYIPLGTHNVGDACPVAGEISLDASHLWTCSPTTGVQFGAGTWQEH